MTVGDLTSMLWALYDRNGGRPKALKLLAENVQQFSLGTPVEPPVGSAAEALARFKSARMDPNREVVVLTTE